MKYLGILLLSQLIFCEPAVGAEGLVLNESKTYVILGVRRGFGHIGVSGACDLAGMHWPRIEGMQRVRPVEEPTGGGTMGLYRAIPRRTVDLVYARDEESPSRVIELPSSRGDRVPLMDFDALQILRADLFNRCGVPPLVYEGWLEVLTGRRTTRRRYIPEWLRQMGVVIVAEWWASGLGPFTNERARPLPQIARGIGDAVDACYASHRRCDDLASFLAQWSRENNHQDVLIGPTIE